MRYHRCTRHTEDLDIFLERAESSVDALLVVLGSLQTSSLQKVRDHLLREEKTVVWNKVDVFTTMRKMEFSDLHEERIVVPYLDLKVPVISLRQLKAAKRIALEDPERRARWADDQSDLTCLEQRCRDAV